MGIGRQKTGDGMPVGGKRSNPCDIRPHSPTERGFFQNLFFGLSEIRLPKIPGGLILGSALLAIGICSMLP